VFIHHGIRGAMMNNLMADSEGLPLAMFDGFDAVLSGHYHKRQQVGRVWYIGSPWQTKADEIGQSKGYALWDGKRLKYVDASWGPRHYKFTVDDPWQELDLSMVRSCDRVRVEITHPRVDREKIAAQLAKVGVLPVVEGAQAPEIKQRLGAAGSLEEYAGRYIEAFAAERQLEGSRLHDVFRRITR
jgi:DNA repair exonuclease SbcCD nuclease subunit